MTGAPFAQVARPTFTRNQRNGRFQPFFGRTNRLGERLLEGLTGFDRMLVRLGRRLQGVNHRFVADGGFAS